MNRAAATSALRHFAVNPTSLAAAARELDAATATRPRPPRPRSVPVAGHAFVVGPDATITDLSRKLELLAQAQALYAAGRYDEAEALLAPLNAAEAALKGVSHV